MTIHLCKRSTFFFFLNPYTKNFMKNEITALLSVCKATTNNCIFLSLDCKRCLVLAVQINLFRFDSLNGLL